MLFSIKHSPDLKELFLCPSNFFCRDCLAAFDAVRRNYTDAAIAVGGDSAGAVLAADVVRGRQDAGIAFQLLVYPVCDAAQSTASMAEFTDTPLWDPVNNAEMWRLYLKNTGNGDSAAAGCDTGRIHRACRIRLPARRGRGICRTSRGCGSRRYAQPHARDLSRLRHSAARPGDPRKRRTTGGFHQKTHEKRILKSSLRVF